MTVISIQAGIPAQAAFTSEAREAWEEQKQEMLQALDELRDLGFSPMDITQNLLSSEEEEGSAAGPETGAVENGEGDGAQQDLQGAENELWQKARDIGGDLQEKTRKAGEELTEKASQAGEELIDQAGEAAKEQAESLLDQLKDRLLEKFSEWIDHIF